MTFGQIIKKLRRDADMTQERLAELLSISPQAVSRWETDVAMPDVSLLPPIANLFDVTTDYLLGVDIAKKEARIKEICKEANQRSCEGSTGWAEAVKMIRSALVLYPNNWELKWWLMTYLFFNRTDGDKEKYGACIKELIPLCEDILANDPNEIHRRQAITHIIRTGKSAGNLQRAMELLKVAPDMNDCQPVLATWVNFGDAQTEAQKYLIFRCIQQIYSALIELSNSDSGFTNKEKLALLDKAKTLYETLYDGDDYSTVLYPWMNALDYADIAAKCGDCDKVFDILNNGLKRKYALCEHDFNHISPLLPRKDGLVCAYTEMTKEEWRISLTNDVVSDDIPFMEKYLPDSIKSDPRYEQYKSDLLAFKAKYFEH